MVRRMMKMERNRARRKLRASSIERLGVPEQHDRNQCRQRGSSRILVVHSWMRFEVVHSLTRFREIPHDRLLLNNRHDRLRRRPSSPVAEESP